MSFIDKVLGKEKIDLDDHGKLCLRLMLGVLMLLHGQAKLVNGIDASIVPLITGIGLPAFLAYLVFVGEVIAPLFVIAGFWTRAAAALVAINMIVAILLVFSDQLFTRASGGGWTIELQAFYLFSAIIVMLLGAGRFSAGGSDGRWN